MTITAKIQEKLENYRTHVLMAIDYFSQGLLHIRMPKGSIGWRQRMLNLASVNTISVRRKDVVRECT